MLYRSITSQSLHYYSRPHEKIPQVPLSGPSAWYGRTVRQHNEWRVHLTAAQLGELSRAADSALASGKDTEKLTDRDFPLSTLAQDITRWRHELQRGRGFVMLRGIPVEQWGEAKCEVLFWCLGWHLGLPGAQNRFGELLGHVRDTGADPNDPSVREYRTRVNISFHCDAADVVGLMCLRSAKSGGASRIASSVTIFNELLKSHPQSIGRLFEPFLLDAHAEGGLQTFPITPCRYFDGRLSTFYHSGYFRSAARYEGVPPLSDAEVALLDAYDALASDPGIHLEMDLQPGDIQLCSNHTIVHSRSDYEDHSDPALRRHLLRLWLSLPEPRALGYRCRKAHNKLQLLTALLRCRWQQYGRITKPV